MNKKTVKRILMRGGLAVLSSSLALVGAYLLTPARTRVVNLGGNTYVKPHDDEQESYFNTFVNRVKNASDADNDETIPGLKASFEGFELTWGGLVEGSNTPKNDIKIGGDIFFSMNCIDNIKFTTDLDVDYNGKNIDLALGYVESDFYLAVKDFRIKNTSVDRETLVDTIRELFFDPENEEGLGIYVDPGDLFNGFLGSETFTNLLGSLGSKDESEEPSEYTTKMNFTIDEQTNEEQTVITDTINVVKEKYDSKEVLVDTENFISIELGLVRNPETNVVDLSYVDLGTISINDFTIKGKINITVDENIKVYRLDDENYQGKQRGEFVEVLNYVGWAHKLLNFLQTRKIGLELDANIGNETQTLANVQAKVDVDLANFIPDLTKLVLDSSIFEKDDTEEEAGEKTTAQVVEDILGKLYLGVDVDVYGPEISGNRSKASLGIHYADNVGYIALNEGVDEHGVDNTVMRAKVETETINDIIAKIPAMKDAVMNEADADEEKANELFDFVTSSELVTAIKDGRYDGILDVLKTLRNDNSTVTLGLDLSSLGFGNNAEIEIVLDSNLNEDSRVLNVTASNIELGSARLDLNLKTKPYSATSIENAVANSDKYDNLRYLPSVFDQVTTILQEKQAGFKITGSVKDAQGLGLDLNGWGEFDYDTRFGYGQLNINQYKELKNGSPKLHTTHVIKLDVDNKSDDKSANNAKFTYGANDGMKGKFTVQTVLDIMDLVKTFINENKDDERFTKFIDPVLDLLGVSYIGNAIEDTDYVRFATNEVVKQIKESADGSYVRIVINGGIMSLEDDLEIRINYKGTGDNRQIDSLSVPGLAYKDKTIILKLQLQDYQNLGSPVPTTGDFIDFSQIKVLLDFGLNTTKQGYYKLSGKLSVGIGSFSALKYDLDFHVVVKGKKTYVYGTIPELQKFLGLTNNYLTMQSATSEFAFEPSVEASGNDIGGYFHIMRTEKTKATIFSKVKTTGYYYKTDSKNFIDSDNHATNLLYYLLTDMLNIYSSEVKLIANKIGESNDSTGKPADIENIFKDGGFTYTHQNGSNKHEWDIGINLGALLNTSVLGVINVGLTGLEASNGKGYLKDLSVNMNIISFLKVSAEFSLDNAGSTATDWTSTIQGKYDTLLNRYNNLSASNKNDFNNNYFNQPLKAWTFSL